MSIRERKSRTYTLANAVVTIHGYSPGTAILHVTGTNDAGHISVWVSPEELRDLGTALLDISGEICSG